ncbi:UNVERIFIED_CONTAM: hypothetical protein Sradi_3640100 [Sesamum radiatum]|uniref:Uncharacterized protein n=1 Tax=Sesamum radiatum TaxID=300843 RepID=A0AAW2QIB7_SESRA
MPEDPIELEVLEDSELGCDTNAECVSTIESNPALSAWRDALATTMYNSLLGRV